MKKLLILLLFLPSLAHAQTLRADRFTFNTGPCTLRSGSGSPEGVVVGNVCDTYWRTDTGDVYRKASGTGNTGWVVLGGIGGSGTPGTIAKWITSTSIGDSSLSESSGNLLLSPAGDIYLDPIGNDVLPVFNYDINLGALGNKYLTLHAAELWVETLVAQSTMATIGGRVLVAPTNILVADFAPATTTITVKYNNLQNGDRVYLEADGKVEFLSVDSGAGGSAGAYTYTVTRNLDGSGANQWYAGDAVLNTGQTGNGFIDLYSVAGVLSGAGPTIVGNVRTGSTYNAIEPRWAIGNLNGLYGYSSSIYGSAFGVPSGTNVTVDATNGFRIRSGATDKLVADTAGNLSMVGDLTVGTNGVIRSAGATAYGTGTGFWIAGGTTPVFRVGNPAGAQLTWNGTTLAITGVDGAGITNIDGNNIQTGTVSANKLTIGGSGAALNTDPDLLDLTAWTLFSGSAGSIAAPSDGVAGPRTLRGASDAASGYRSNLIAYDPSKSYVVRVWVRRTSNADGTFYAGVMLFDGSGGFLDVSYVAASNVTVTTSWAEYTGTLAVGAFSTAHKSIALLLNLNFGGTLGYLEVQNPRLEEAAPSVLIQDGAITAVKIQADSITANQIAANAITTTELNADAVTSAKIAANTITAGDIAAGTITATELAADSVTASKIDVATLSAISADIGTVTAGTIDGVTIFAGSGDQVTLNASGITLDQGTGTLNSINWSDGTRMYSSADDFAIISGRIALLSDNDVVLDAGRDGSGFALIHGSAPPRVTPLAGLGASRFVCHDNDGDLYSSATTCDGSAPAPSVTARVEWLEAEVARLTAELARLAAIQGR